MPSSKRYLPKESETSRAADWRKFKTGNGHSKRFEHIMDFGRWNDVTFIVGTSRKTFKVHSLILRTGSQVFDDLFKENGHISWFYVPDVEPTEFFFLLQFLYTGYTITNKNTTALLILASKYEVWDLVELCEKELCVRLSEKTALELYQLANKYNAENLKEAALKLIFRHGATLIKSQQFQDLSTDEVCSILKRKNLNVFNESEIFEAAVSWAKIQCKRENLMPSSEFLRSKLEKVIPFIRFSNMDPTYFALSVVPTNILSTEEIVPIFQYFAIAKQETRSGSLLIPLFLILSLIAILILLFTIFSHKK